MNTSNLKNFDIFSVSYKWRTFGKENFKSFFGASLSICLIAYLFVKAIILIKLYISKEKFSIIQTVVRNARDELKINEFRTAVCSYDKNYAEVNKISDRLNITNGVLKDYYQLNTSHNGKIIEGSCNKMNINETIYQFMDNGTYIENEIKNCYCINFKNITLYKNNFEYSSQSIYLKIKPIESADKNENYYLYLLYGNYYFDYSKKIPFVNYNRMSYDSFTSNQMVQKFFSIDKLSFTDDAFKFDFFENEGTPNFSYEISDYFNTFYDDYNRENYFCFNFSFSNKLIKYEVNLFSVDDIMAIFGGYFQIIFFVFNFICNMYNDFYKKKKISLHFKNHYKSMDKKRLDYIKNSNQKTLSIDVPNRLVRTININTKIENSNISSLFTKFDNKDIIPFKHLRNFKENIKIFSNDFEKLTENLFNEIADFKSYFEMYSDVQLIKSLIIKNEMKELFEISKFWYLYKFGKNLSYEENFRMKADESIESTNIQNKNDILINKLYY